jgi:hypothetical protein
LAQKAIEVIGSMQLALHILSAKESSNSIGEGENLAPKRELEDFRGDCAQLEGKVAKQSSAGDVSVARKRESEAREVELQQQLEASRLDVPRLEERVKHMSY